MLASKLTLYLDGEEVELDQGNVVFNRGNLHGRRNKGMAVARILVVNVDALAVGNGGTAF